MGSTIRNRFGRNAESLREQREAEALADKEVRENWDDDAFRAQWHADMAEVIWLGFQHENLVELMSTPDYVGEFDRITAEEWSGLEAFWVSNGGQLDASTIDGKVWELAPDWVGYYVTEFEDNIRNGFSRYQNRLVPLAIQQVDAAINARLLRTFQAAIPDVSSDSFITTNGFSLSAVNTALTEVGDEASGWPEADASTITIIGRQTMVDEFLNALVANDNFAPSVQEEIIRLGLLGTYRGANIIKLKNWKDRNRVSYFPGNELLIMSTAASKYGFWDGDKSREWTEEGGEYWHHWGKRKANCVVHRPEFARRYVDSSKAA